MENLNYVLDVLVAAREKLKDNDLHDGVLKNQIGEAFEILVSEINKTSFSENEVLAFFSRMVTNGVFLSETKDGKFKPERNYRIAKRCLQSHLGIDYEKADYSNYQNEIQKIIKLEK